MTVSRTLSFIVGLSLPGLFAFAALGGEMCPINGGICFEIPTGQTEYHHAGEINALGTIKCSNCPEQQLKEIAARLDRMERARICRPGFSDTIRPSVMATEAVKRAMLRGQGIPMSDIGKYELDHIVPLCLDGAPLEFSNLQLQLWPVAHAKDMREAAVCRAYCAPGSVMTLEEAQGMFHRDQQ